MSTHEASASMSSPSGGSSSGRLSGKVAVVTGSASGLGESIAMAFAQEGALVVGVDQRQRRRRPGVVDDDGIEELVADVSQPTEVEQVFAEVARRTGRLDVLCHCAGVLIDTDTPLCEVDVVAFDKTLEVNVRGTFLTMKYGIPLIADSGGGSVINLASIAGLVAQPGAAAYIASKGAVLMMTRAAALDYARRGVRVNAICPGTIETPMIESLPRERIAALEELHPVGRLGQAKDIAATAVFLASEDCTFATGASFIIDGGRTAT